MGCSNCRGKRPPPQRHTVPPERLGMKQRDNIMTAEMFNDMYATGSKFRYYPIRGDDEFVETATRSVAWTLGHGDAVVLVEGKTGGVLIEHLRAIL